MKLALLTLVLFVGAQSFTIPLLFGGISIDKTPNNEVAIGFNRGINIQGNGFDRSTNFVVGNGTFNANDAAAVLVNGKRTGPRTSFGAGKDGFKIGTDVLVEEKTKRSARK
ncbi:hypothetical protein ANCCEY_09277 [Ancylostoma ceylanicum]|uniref:Uncharacterized protein n=2 Tax=Ancylostoma ceylanicum TaxID=53326 RepID=A0A0D6LNL6_9BILA|nr:hypothetical protein ANCCEY_09277 [Ancylostoma ceylanicum]EYC23924.1 hypothetical protein Y032_0014g2219 [Ancylostoma ceylanicum]